MKEHDATEIAYNNGKEAGRAEAFAGIREKVNVLAENNAGLFWTTIRLKDLLYLIDRLERGE